MERAQINVLYCQAHRGWSQRERWRRRWRRAKNEFNAVQEEGRACVDAQPRKKTQHERRKEAAAAAADGDGSRSFPAQKFTSLHIQDKSLKREAADGKGLNREVASQYYIQ